MKVALFKGRGVISALIRWQTRGEYSHAGIVLEDGSLVEAWQGEGVRRRAEFKHGIADVDFFEVLGMDARGEARATGFALAQVGKGYDYMGVARFVSRRGMKANERWFCSELAYAVVAEGGVELFAETEGWEVEPTLLKRSPRLRRIARGLDGWIEGMV